MMELKRDANFSLVIDGMGRKLLQHASTMSICVYGRRVLESASASSPMGLSNASPEVSPGAHTSDHTFDSSLIIILSALLGSLLCSLGLSTLVRCSLHCRGRIALESSDEMAIPVAHMGPKSKVMEALPTLFYKTGSKPLGVDSDCPIYLADFVEGERVRVLPKCNHYFHVDCIDTWLVSNSSCSTCRHYLLDDMDSLRCLAKSQVKIENAFGTSKGSWRILRDMDIDLEKVPRAIVACCVLHKFLQLNEDVEIEVQLDKHPNS
eukprot:Gb_14784 [translate_table: standard]